MTATKSALPSSRMPAIDIQTGCFTSPWYSYWQQEHTRTGGDKVDKVEEAAQVGTVATIAAATANAAAATANAAAATAQAAADAAAAAAGGSSTLQSLQVSGVDPNTSIVTHDAGASITILINPHIRYYGDGTNASVNAGTVGSLSYNTVYYIWYDDPTRAGGAVTYHADTSTADVFPTDMHPDRHYVGSAPGILMGDPDADGSPNYWAP